MSRLFISTEEIQAIIERLDKIEKALQLKQKHPEQMWYDNSEICQVLNISKGTAAKWRQKGYLKPKKIDGKFYYLQSDIISLLKNEEVTNERE